MPRIVPSQVVTLVDRLFPWGATQKNTKQEVQLERSSTNSLAAVVELADQIPPELITLDPDSYAVYVTSLTAIRTAIRAWQTGGGVDYLTKIPGLGNLNPVTLLRDYLELCPDEFPAPSTAELSFIADQAFRNNLRIDISAAHQAYGNGEYKAATVLAGASVEALLLWALQQQSEEVIKTAADKIFKKTDKGLEYWYLHQLIEVANELKIVKKETIALIRLAKDFRNLIHPGRSIRLAQICDRSTTLSTLAALEAAARDLSRMDENRLKQIIIDWASKLPYEVNVFLFGSRLKGTAKQDYDLDIAIEFLEQEEALQLWGEVHEKWQNYLSREIGLKVHLELFEDDKSPNLKAYLNEASILLYSPQEP